MVHDELVSRLFPGVEPVSREEFRDRPLLESAAARPFQTAGGIEIYGAIDKKAAALFHSLIANHPFHNGNKRTAIVALDHFLLANRLLFVSTQDQTYRLASLTASYREQEMSHVAMLEEIARVIRLNIISIGELRNFSWTRGAYSDALRSGREIRSHKLNRPQPG